MTKPLFSRLVWAKKNLQPIQSKYCVAYETPEGSLAIMHPDPNWMACAMHGNILPPAHVYDDLEHDENGRVINGRILHETVIGPLTEEEAIEYLIEKDVPRVVRERSLNSNRAIIQVITRDMLPQSRKYRNAWRLAND